MSSGNELTELYDSLAVLYRSLPTDTDSEWREALKSVLYGGELLAAGTSCYGAQQKNRNEGTRKEYAQQHGNGKRVTNFSAITVAEPRTSDRQYVPTGAKLPVAPKSGVVLPVNVSSEEVEWAISLLAEFPAEPAADRPGNGLTALLDREGLRGGEGSETTILFVSDTHLGYENRIETKSGKRVPWIDEIDSRETIQRMRTIAVQQDVDAVVHTGDILDHEVDQITLDTAASSLRRLKQDGIPVYCILGTHDHGAANPTHPKSVDGGVWLHQQIRDGTLVELSMSPTPIAGGRLNLYGVSAGNVGITELQGSYSSTLRCSDISFDPAPSGQNILCLHDKVTPRRERSAASIDLDALLAQSQVSFDCVLVGDEHRPRGDDFRTGYSFETADGTPVLYTGPAARIGPAYRNNDPFVTEITVSVNAISWTRHLF